DEDLAHRVAPAGDSRGLDLDDRAGREQSIGDEDLGLAAVGLMAPVELEPAGPARGPAVLVAESQGSARSRARVRAWAEVGPEGPGGVEDVEILGVPAILGEGIPPRRVVPLGARDQASVEAVVQGVDVGSGLIGL